MRKITRIGLIALVLAISCGKDDKTQNLDIPFEFIVNPGTDKEQRINIKNQEAPLGKKMYIKYNGKNKNCSDCLFEWKKEDFVLGTGSGLNIVFCSVEKQNIIFRVIGPDGNEIENISIGISVSSSETRRTDEIQRSLDIFKNDVIVIGVDRSQDRESLQKISSALLALQTYVDKENSCDAEVVYALTIGKIILILSELQNLVVEYFTGTLKKEDILLILDKGVKPAKADLEAVLNSGSLPRDFSFRVKNLQIYVIRDFPETEISEKLYINLSGEHDITDFYFLISFVEFISGFFDLVLSYNLAIDFLLDIPPKVSQKINQNIPLNRALTEEFIGYLISNPAFLGLSVDAYYRLKDAQSSFYNAFKALQRMFDSLREETDDQADDIIRYWDCGKDKVCPGDREDEYADINGNGKRDDNEPYLDLNRNGQWNPAYSQPDEGEGNKKYDIGEIIGTEKFKFTGNDDGIFLNLSGQVGNAIYQAIFQNKVFDIVAQNFIGGILDIGKIIGQSNESLRDLLCSLGISFPEVRIWEFFVSPSSMRDMLPRWDPEKKSIIIQRDTEAFLDTGLDRKFSWDYPGYHPLSNPDPERDDVGFSNESDGFDTDDDGKCANEEAYTAWKRKNNGEEPRDQRDCINFINSGIDNFDLGTEGNLLFDWKDRNNNKVPDKGDITEPWDDDGGILNGQGSDCGDVKVRGNNKFDVCDSDHYWPDGKVDPKNSVGPGGLICRTGVYGGDGNNEVIDLLYFLFPDPTFSGVLRLYKGESGVVKNKEGKVLTDNALLHRTIWKGLATIGIVENYPYR